jgi:hypothetical protein
MPAWQFAADLERAINESTPEVHIFDLFITKGFSGGGAYMNVPARAVHPCAATDAPGT